MSQSIDGILKTEQSGSGLGNILASSSLQSQPIIRTETIPQSPTIRKKSKRSIVKQKKRIKRKRNQTGGNRSKRQKRSSNSKKVKKATKKRRVKGKPRQVKEGRVKKLRKLYAIRRATF